MEKNASTCKPVMYNSVYLGTFAKLFSGVFMVAFLKTVFKL